MIRLFDILFSALGLIVLSPFLLILYILIRVESKGGGIYAQDRIGLNGVPFKLYKFRTMVVGSDKGGLITVGGRDSRLTRIGYRIRKYKLDELPQLWNVFVGDMSFVGPRPDVPGYANKLEGDDKRILSLRPGVTGPATMKYRNEEELIANFIKDAKNNVLTVNGLSVPGGLTDEELALWYNDNIIYPDKVRLNLYYLDHYSFWKDIQMIIYTLQGKKMKYNNELI